VAGLLAAREMRRNPNLHGLGRARFGIVIKLLRTVGLILMTVALVRDYIASGSRRW
jgi:hypothetical protein